jgi:alkyldihydroxyacetonephosphate synthase
MHPQTPTAAHSTDAVDTRAVAHDLWPRRLLLQREQAPTVLPARVVWPNTLAELQEVVRHARRERISLVPFGAGSGVVGGVSPTSSAWVVDLKRMQRIVRIDAAAGEVVVEAGMLGDRLERALNEAGFTLGHFPSSLYCSTVGGWVATRSAGQLSSRYGKIEDMLLGIVGVDGTGAVVEAHIDDMRTGPGLLQLLCGSEGALCIITQVRLRIERMPSHRWLRGFSFPSLDDSVLSMQRLMQAGVAPSVLRLYDPLDAALSGTSTKPVQEADHIIGGAIAHAGIEHSGPVANEDPGAFEHMLGKLQSWMVFQRPGVTRTLVGEALARPALLSGLLEKLDGKPRLIVGLEGSADAIQQKLPIVRQHLASANDLGSAPGEKWLLHRHRVSYRMSKFFAAGGWVDTCETACAWQQVVPLYHAMRDALRDVAVVLCHFSHAYVDGCSLYFTFCGGGTTGTKGPRTALARYDLTWERALLTLRRHGAAWSHHHGVGRLKAPLARDDASHALRMQLKRALDPDGILNPGVMGLRTDAEAS